MLNRRELLEQTLKAPLVALGTAVPGFLARTARAAAARPGADNVLVVLELNGGNDGLNTVVPHADDLYHRARPTLRLRREQLIRVNDHVGLNPGLRGLDRLLQAGQLTIVQGVGYPNPNRSHFESMDVWQSAVVRGREADGWLGRSLGSVRAGAGQIPGMYVGAEALPLALRGPGPAVPAVHPGRPYGLDLASPPTEPSRVRRQPGAPASDPDTTARRRLIEELAALPAGEGHRLGQFVQRSSVQTYAPLARLRQVVESAGRGADGRGGLARDLGLVAGLIAAGLGTRVFSVSLGGFDTHANQLTDHQRLLQQVGDAVASFFAELQRTGHARRVVLLTFSEFGRRVQENGSRGTDHGAASCLFVAGPAVKGGVLGEHPSLRAGDLDEGDLRQHTDFRRVYATLLDGWLGCPSREVLGQRFQHLPLLRR
jgi:uncharacterized protein (DUF1501 family)